MAEEIIDLVELKIDQSEVIRKLTELTEAIKKNREETRNLEKQNKDLEEAGQKNTQQYKDNATQIELNKGTLKGLSTEYGNNQKILTDLTKSETAELGTLQQLAIQNKQLADERKKLNLTTDQGKQRLIEINKQLDANNKIIKDNADATLKQKLNIGNYQSALDKLPGPLAGAVSGSKALLTAFRALLSNPIGLIIAAVALALKALADAFRTSQPLMDKFHEVGAGIAAVWKVIVDRVAEFAEKFIKLIEEPKEAIKDFGKSIVEHIVNRFKAIPDFAIKVFQTVKNAIKGNFDEAKKSAKEAGLAFTFALTGVDAKKLIDNIKGVGEEMKQEGFYAAELKKAMDALEDREISYMKTLSNLRREKEELILSTRDENLTAEERLAALDEAIAKTHQAYAIEISFAKERARISQEQIDMGKATREERRKNEELQVRAIELEAEEAKGLKRLSSQRLKTVKEIASENLDALNKEIEIYKEKNKTLIDNDKALSEELINNEKARIADIEKKQLETLDYQLSQELIKQQDYELSKLKIISESFDQQNTLDDNFSEFQRAKQLTDLENQIQTAELKNESYLSIEMARLESGRQQEIIEAKKTGADTLLIDEKYAQLRINLEEEVQRSKYEAMSSIIGDIGSLFEENTVIAKLAAVAQATINTYLGATAAFAQTPGGIFIKSLAAGAAIAMGLKSVGKILAVNPKSASAPSAGGYSSGPMTVGSGLSGGVTSGTGMPVYGAARDGGLSTQGIRDNMKEAVKAGVKEAMLEAPIKDVLVVEEVNRKQSVQKIVNEIATV